MLYCGQAYEFYVANGYAHSTGLIINCSKCNTCIHIIIVPFCIVRITGVNWA